MLALLFLISGCTRIEEHVRGRVELPIVHRMPVAPVWTVERQTGLTVHDWSCTCNTPESSPAPSKYESECDERFAICGEVHYQEFLDRSPGLRGRDRLGVLLTTHFVESQVYDATITFDAKPSTDYAEHASSMRVSIGDVIPTPHGRARVVQVYRSYNLGQDDGRVRLHYLERFASEKPWLLFVSSGAPSRLGDDVMTLVDAVGGEANIIIESKGMAKRPERLTKGDTLRTSKGLFRVVDVADGYTPGDLGWVAIDTRLDP